MTNGDRIDTPDAENKSGNSDNLRNMNAARQEFLRAFSRWLSEDRPHAVNGMDEVVGTKSAMTQLVAIFADHTGL